MTELTKPIYSMQPISEDAAKKHIASMFVGLQSQDKGGLNAALVANYLEAVQDIPEWAVEQATEMYRTGKRGNGRFVPMGAELAKCARELIEAREDRKRHQARMAGQAAQLKSQIAEQQRLKDFHSRKTDESRARVQSLLEKTKQNITSQDDVSMHESTTPEITRRTHKRFAEQGRKNLLKVLETQA